MKIMLYFIATSFLILVIGYQLSVKSGIKINGMNA